MSVLGGPPTPPPTDGGGDVEGDLTSEVDSTIKVALDKWSIGQIGWPDVWLAIAVFAFAILLAYLVRRLIKRSTRSLDGSAAATIAVLGQIVSVGIYLFAIAIVLEVLGFTLGPVLIIALLVVVLLIVLRPVVQNLSSGLLLQLRGQCRPGDVVAIDGEVGTVEEVNTRAVILATADGRTVVLPNDKVITDKLINYSRLGRRRSHITIMLPGDTDLDLMTERVLEVLEGLPGVLGDPAPAVRVTGFGGTQIWADVQFWFSPEIGAEMTARDQVGRALSRLANAGIRLSDSSSIVHVTRR